MDLSHLILKRFEANGFKSLKRIEMDRLQSLTLLMGRNNAGKSKVFATTLGHNNGTMQHAVYQEIVTRGLLWSVGKLGPDGNPVEGYGPVKK